MNGICNVYKKERERMREQKKNTIRHHTFMINASVDCAPYFFFFFFLWGTRRGQGRSQQQIDAIIMES